MYEDICLCIGVGVGAEKKIAYIHNNREQRNKIWCIGMTVTGMFSNNL